jgi:hypothetical protein
MNAITDMTAFTAPRSDQLNADDLVGGPRTVRITKVVGTGATDQPVAVHFDGDDGRPFKPCKSMRRVMVAAWGADASQYAGRSMTLYRDPKVAFGGMEVGGIRISHMSHMERDMTMALTVTKAKRAPYVVKVLKVEQPATAPAEDRARAAADALLARIAAAATDADLRALTADEKVSKTRAALREKRPELADEVDAAVSARLAVMGDDFPGDR